jgi:hypothetical protein
MCEATNPVDDELVNVAKSYLSMNDSKIFPSEIANDAGTYIFLSVRPQAVRLTLRMSAGRRCIEIGGTVVLGHAAGPEKHLW